MSDVPGTQQTRTASHLLATIQSAAGHVSRHLASAMQADTPEGLAHDLKHAANHTAEVIEHARKLHDHLAENPDIADENAELADVTRSAEAQLAGPAPGPDGAVP